MKENPLLVLGLTPGSTLEQARDCYRVLAKKYHPDKGAPSSERFLELRDAIDAIEGDPTLLNSGESFPERTVGKDLWVTAEIKMEDLVFRDEVSIVVHPKMPCPRCAGTGASDRKFYTCGVCSGKGRIPGEIMRMVAGSNECPGCGGTGVHIPLEGKCTLCKGSSLVSSTKIKGITSGPALLAGGSHNFVYSGEGHAAPYGGKPGDLHLILKIEDTAGLEYMHGKAVVWVETTPAAYVVGGDVSVVIMGEKVCGTMQPMTGRADVEFRGKPIQIRASIVIPYRLTRKIKEQYAILRALELRGDDDKEEIPHASSKNSRTRSELPADKTGQQWHKVRNHPVKQRPGKPKGPKPSASRSK